MAVSTEGYICPHCGENQDIALNNFHENGGTDVHKCDDCGKTYWVVCSLSWETFANLEYVRAHITKMKK